MLYADFITELRRESKDNHKPAQDKGTGDGVRNSFELHEKPVLENSYTVTIEGTPQTEDTDYTIDRESGWITFTTEVPNASGVTVNYKYVNMTDTGWLNVINDVIHDLDSYGYFYTEVMDDTTLTSLADTVSYSCPADCKEVVNVWFRRGSDSTYDWYDLSEIVNWRYSRQGNKIYIGKDITAGYPMRVQYLSFYQVGTATTDTIPVQDEYLNMLKQGSLARYYEHLLGAKVQVDTKISREITQSPLSDLQNLVRHYERRYQDSKVRSKPAKPMRTIFPNLRSGGSV